MIERNNFNLLLTVFKNLKLSNDQPQNDLVYYICRCRVINAAELHLPVQQFYSSSVNVTISISRNTIAKLYAVADRQILKGGPHPVIYPVVIYRKCT